jgi:hypothetical protein
MHLCSYCKLVKLLCEASQSGSGEGENRRFQKKIFAECLSRRSRQRLCSLPSLTPPAHGKERTFCRASLLQHSAQSIHFTECWRRTLGKEHNLCRVSSHFAECFSQTLGKRPSPFLPPSRPFFLPRAGLGTRQNLYRVPDKKHSTKRSLPTLSLPSSLYRVQHSTKFLPSVYVILPSVPHTHLANEASACTGGSRSTTLCCH